MKKESRIREYLKPYTLALPDIFNYQIVTKAILCIWLFLLGRLFQALLKSSGRVAVTSGDWQFLFTTWQGILILLLYIALIAPILGFGISISATENLYIPTFISSFIEGRENTLSGLETAWTAGAYGSEIDIQRTKDGFYIINHDGTFKRIAGDSRKPEEMDLREVKKRYLCGRPIRRALRSIFCAQRSTVSSRIM